jgi:hypothetical protein
MAPFVILLGLGLVSGLVAGALVTRARRRREREPILVSIDATLGPCAIVGAQTGLWYRDADSVDEAWLAVVRLGVEATRRGALEPYRIVPRHAVPPSAYRLPEGERV